MWRNIIRRLRLNIFKFIHMKECQILQSTIRNMMRHFGSSQTKRRILQSVTLRNGRLEIKE